MRATQRIRTRPDVANAVMEYRRRRAYVPPAERCLATCSSDAEYWDLTSSGRGVFFFFSSRRRHTRSLRDWSSDVCSSDLGMTVDSKGRPWIGGFVGGSARYTPETDTGSEERRVGKECRSRWSPDQ